MLQSVAHNASLRRQRFVGTLTDQQLKLSLKQHEQQLHAAVVAEQPLQYCAQQVVVAEPVIQPETFHSEYLEKQESVDQQSIQNASLQQQNSQLNKWLSGWINAPKETNLKIKTNKEIEHRTGGPIPPLIGISWAVESKEDVWKWSIQIPPAIPQHLYVNVLNPGYLFNRI